MRCFTFEKVLLFCPQVSVDIAFKYMLQLTNCIKSFFTLLLVSDRGLFHSGDMKDRAARGAQPKQNMVLMLPGIATMPVPRACFPFFRPSYFGLFCCAAGQNIPSCVLRYRENHQLLLLASVQLHKKTERTETRSTADRSSNRIQEGIFDSCCA